MTIENIYQAKTHLSRLVDEVLEGKDVVIARSGRPLVRLIPYEPKPEGLTYGLLKGKIWMAEDFDDSEEWNDMFREYTPE